MSHTLKSVLNTYQLRHVAYADTLKQEVSVSEENNVMYHRMSRDALSEGQNHRCCYCSGKMTLENNMASTMATREHIIPRVFGGPTEFWNLTAACNECNSLRGHMDAQAFYWMRQKMTIREIRVLRHSRFEREVRWYREVAAGNVVIVWVFWKRLFGYAPVIPTVEIKKLA